MALLWWEGGEGITSSDDMKKKWASLGGHTDGTFLMETSLLRAGALGARYWSTTGNAGAVNFITVANISTVIVEFWFRPQAINSADILYLRDASDNTHFKLTRVLSGSNLLLRAWNANNVQVGADINLGSSIKWTHVGIKLTTGAAGTLTIKIDDVVWINNVTDDFLNGSNNYVSKVAWNANSGGTTLTYYDDNIIMDTTGSVDNDFKGSSVHVVCSRPTAAGDSTQWTPSTGSNYQNVDETDPDDDTTYNSSSTAGHLDLFNITDLPAFTGNVLGADIWGFLRKDGGGTEQIKLAIKTNSSVFYGSDESLTNSYAVYRKQYLTNPATGNRFTDAEANALQIGAAVV